MCIAEDRVAGASSIFLPSSFFSIEFFWDSGFLSGQPLMLEREQKNRHCLCNEMEQAFKNCKLRSILMLHAKQVACSILIAGPSRHVTFHPSQHHDCSRPTKNSVIAAGQQLHALLI
jgi:hypothetical protein